MTTSLDLIVNKSDLTQIDWVAGPAQDQITLADGQILVRVEKFAFTANNITYAVAGDMIGYWNFFPTNREGWGRIPAFGYATIVRSHHPDIREGERLYGYFPMSSHLVMQPEKVTARTFLDHIEHRKSLHDVYNTYTRLADDPDRNTPYEDLRPILNPLFTTSFLIDAFLADNAFFGAHRVVILSASSKTGLALAFCLHERNHPGLAIAGLTSPSNTTFVESLGCYTEVLTYDAVTAFAPNIPTAIVDMAGNGQVLSALHHHLGNQVRYSGFVGKSHWQGEGTPPDMPGAAPTFFFAPDQVQKLTAELGQEEFNRRLGASWYRFRERAQSWFTVVHSTDREAISKVYNEALAGHISPSTAHIFSVSE